MTHAEWLAQAKAGLSNQQDGNPLEAIRILKRLTARSKRESDSAITSWHYEQSLKLLTHVLERAGQATEAIRTIAKARRLHTHQTNYHGRATASALAVEALLRLQQPNDIHAVHTATNALEWAKRYGEAGSLYQAVAEALAQRQSTVTETRAKALRRGQRRPRSRHSTRK